MNRANYPHTVEATRLDLTREFAFRAVRLGALDEIDPQALAAQSRRSRITVIVGFLGMVAVAVYLIWGPRLVDPRSAGLAGLFFLCGFALFTVGLLTSWQAVWVASEQSKLRAVRDSNRAAEARKNVAKLLEIVDKVKAATDSGINPSPVLASHDSEISEIRTELAASGVY